MITHDTIRSGKPRLSLIMPYYKNPTMLSMHYETWAGFPDEVKALFEVIIVDDGSPEEKAVDVPRPDGLPKLRIFEVEEDRLWYQHAARNIGAFEAVCRLLLLTDMDHMVTAQLILDAVDAPARSTRFFYVNRKEFDSDEWTLDDRGRRKSHPNTFVMLKKLYWAAGGYDEDYCGHYGTDGLFRHRLQERARMELLPGDGYIRRLWRDLVPDASTRDVKRKEGRRPKFREEIAKWKKREGRPDVVTMTMPYHEAEL
ncbi:MAG: hypothetical protein CMB99_16480 [Flavobacteriaceae bacterium]|jgi:hypothetical protein|nr:hypothetical protein [Flavobacteriaceae bacterium]|tara:strand:+ start:1669 stop:2436 length:768 start_codon:yes stop_codon:yes gene_type:complete